MGYRGSPFATIGRLHGRLHGVSCEPMVVNTLATVGLTYGLSKSILIREPRFPLALVLFSK